MDRRIKAAIQMMLDNKTAQVQIREVAQSVNLSPGHFTRLFKEETCLKPKECVRYWRLQEAKHLLDHTHLKVNEVASAVGFKHLSSFTREFTRLYGCPPSLSRSDHPTRSKSHSANQKEKMELNG
jgi:transcriptional regulator GlxA family with amidase domain